jgi:hypothetical protein
MPRSREERVRVTPKLVANYIPRVIVKFRDNDNKEMLPAERARIQENEIKRYENIERNPEQYLGASWIRLVEQYRGLTIQKLITSVTPQQIIKLRGKARRPDRTYRPTNFLTYFAVRCPSAEIAQKVAKTLRNHELWPAVAGAYVEGGPALPPGVILSTNESVKQGHLDRSPANGGDPGGIDARYAWKISGGDGGGAQVGLQFVDLEWGWVLDHEDLPTIPDSIPTVVGQLAGDNDSNYQGHGTGTLGVVVAVENNSKECVGIAPHVATTKVVSPWVLNGTTWTYSVANAIVAALALPLQPGDVLLLEVQTLHPDAQLAPHSPGKDYPVEVEEAEFMAIQHATKDLGVIVIEAAGNAGVDLDPFTFNTWTTTQFSLNLLDSNFQDSGAIMVGSALIVPTSLASSTVIPRSPNNNYGTRIDCYAWDNNIWTTGYNDPHKSTDPPAPPDPTTSYFGFSGTSGASAIIAGAALAIQGIAQINQKGDLTNGRCSPTQLRDILRNPATGTLSANSKWNTSLNSRWDPSNADFSTWNADRIGSMPDLKKVINNTLEITLLEPLPRIREDLLIKPAKRHGGPGPKNQVLRKKPAKAKRRSPK